MTRNGLVLRGSTPWVALIDGDDVVGRNLFGTCWGGGHDPGDDGQTQSGLPNDGRYAKLAGVALPIRSIERATAGSPLAFPGPHIPWFTKVLVWLEEAGEASAITCQLIDNGPDELHYPTHALDLTVWVAQQFAPKIPLELLPRYFGMTGLSFRIIGAAKYAPAA